MEALKLYIVNINCKMDIFSPVRFFEPGIFEDYPEPIT